MLDKNKLAFQATEYDLIVSDSIYDQIVLEYFDIQTVTLQEILYEAKISLPIPSEFNTHQMRTIKQFLAPREHWKIGFLPLPSATREQLQSIGISPIPLTAHKQNKPEISVFESVYFLDQIENGNLVAQDTNNAFINLTQNWAQIQTFWQTRLGSIVFHTGQFLTYNNPHFLEHLDSENKEHVMQSHSHWQDLHYYLETLSFDQIFTNHLSLLSHAIETEKQKHLLEQYKKFLIHYPIPLHTYQKTLEIFLKNILSPLIDKQLIIPIQSGKLVQNIDYLILNHAVNMKTLENINPYSIMVNDCNAQKILPVLEQAYEITTSQKHSAQQQLPLTVLATKQTYYPLYSLYHCTPKEFLEQKIAQPFQSLFINETKLTRDIMLITLFTGHPIEKGTLLFSPPSHHLTQLTYHGTQPLNSLKERTLSKLQSLSPFDQQIILDKYNKISKNFSVFLETLDITNYSLIGKYPTQKKLGNIIMESGIDLVLKNNNPPKINIQSQKLEEEYSSNQIPNNSLAPSQCKYSANPSSNKPHWLLINISCKISNILDQEQILSLHSFIDNNQTEYTHTLITPSDYTILDHKKISEKIGKVLKKYEV